MDDLTPKPGELHDASDEMRTGSPTPSNGEISAPPAQNVSRVITSKRVVIPANAKRSTKQPSPPTPNQTIPEATTVATTDTIADQESLDATQAKTAPLEQSPVVIPWTPEDSNIPPAPEANPISAPIKPIPQTGESGKNVAVTPRSAPLPYTPSSTTFAPVAETQTKNRRGLEIVLWGIAALLLVAAVIAVVLLVFPNLLSSPTEAVVPPTSVAGVQSTTQPSATPSLLPTSPAPTTANLQPTSAPLVIPTPPADGKQLSVIPDTALTGWVASGEPEPHYGDDNLNAGTFQGKNLASVLQFNLRNLPTDTQLLFAALELTGRDASRLSDAGEWQLELVENSLATDWFSASADQIISAPSLGTMGESVPAAELGEGRLTRFILSASELQLLQQQFKNGNAVFRLRGPAGNEDNLFAWESGANGSALIAPTLHLVFVEGSYVIITNTPEPKNVLTAAAYVVRGTDQAKRNGTPTPFPPGVATATPGGELIIIDAETALPQNQKTAIALAERATAFARTTGTYTPTPKSVVFEFPTFTPVVIVPGDLATATPIPPDTDLVTIPIDYARCQCQGQLLLLSTRYGGERGAPIMLAPDGTELGKLSGDLFYKLAMAREPYSPDRTKRLIYPRDSRGIQQIGFEDIATGEIVFLTHFAKGIAYDAAWAPDGSAIAFIATELDNADQMYIYDFGTGEYHVIIPTPGGQPWFKHPSWSPDSQQIVYWSSVSGKPQIWIVNRDGSNPHNISNNQFTETNPVWVK